MKPESLANLRKLGDKIATELIFAEPGKDLGLLPVNSLLREIEERIAAEPDAQSLVPAVDAAKKWIEEIFQSSGFFSALSIKRFGEWAGWWQRSVSACETGAIVPPIPDEWGTAVGGPAETEATPAGATTLPVVASGGEPLLALNLEQDRELLGEFINESQEHLQNIEQGVLVLEQHPNDADTLNSIFRAFHTFKGGSGFLNLTAIQTVAHDLESLLDMARQQKLAITPAVINVILEGGDTLRQFVQEISSRLSGTKSGMIVVPTLKLLDRIRAALKGESAPAVIHAAPVAPVGSAQPAKGAAVNSVVKVDTVKLDSVVDIVGEMLIAQSLVVQNRALGDLHNEQLNRDLAQLGRISKELQRTVMSLRMIPVRATFQKMNRLVRDLSMKVGKQIELVTEGEETELDRTIVDELSDPLVHMIRNSVDHGIEKPEARLAAGKPAHGTVSLKAFHQGGNIVIEIKDDGGGLNRKRILAKAVEKGLVKPDEQPPDSELFNLIMAAGFSTAEKITDISGRGVGMDVVRRNIEKLRGKIEIRSTEGQGSTFSIFLPLTLAIIDGLLVGVGDQRYIVPTLLVRESFRPGPEMIHTLHGRGEMINLRGKLHPLLRLYSQLGVAPATTDPAQSIVVVVEAGNDVCCLLVDKLLGKHEIVIKSLGETFRRNRYLAGAAILGDGRVGLILDPYALMRDEAALEAAA